MMMKIIKIKRNRERKNKKDVYWKRLKVIDDDDENKKEEEEEENNNNNNNNNLYDWKKK